MIEQDDKRIIILSRAAVSEIEHAEDVVRAALDALRDGDLRTLETRLHDVADVLASMRSDAHALGV